MVLFLSLVIATQELTTLFSPKLASNFSVVTGKFIIGNFL